MQTLLSSRLGTAAAALAALGITVESRTPPSCSSAKDNDKDFGIVGLGLVDKVFSRRKEERRGLSSGGQCWPRARSTSGMTATARSWADLSSASSSAPISRLLGASSSAGITLLLLLLLLYY